MAQGSLYLPGSIFLVVSWSRVRVCWREMSFPSTPSASQYSFSSFKIITKQAALSSNFAFNSMCGCLASHGNSERTVKIGERVVIKESKLAEGAYG